MTAKDIAEVLHREPFEPFRVVTSSGESYVVRNPDLDATKERRQFIALPGDRWTFVPYVHVASVEAVGYGRARRKRRE